MKSTLRKLMASLLTLAMMLPLVQINVAFAESWTNKPYLAKTTLTQIAPGEKEFTLTSRVALVENTTYKVYGAIDDDTVVGTAEIKSIDDRTIFVKLDNAPTRNTAYYLTAQEPGKTESVRSTGFTVKAYQVADSLSFSYGEYSGLTYAEFYQDTEEYNIVLPTGTPADAPISVEIGTKNGATINYDGDTALTNGAGTITATVTAAEGVELSYSYTVNFSTMSIEGEGTQGNPYKITSAAELKQLADCINCGAAAPFDAEEVGYGNYFGYYFELTDDIDLAGIAWEPIGYSGGAYFAGNFDGNGYTVLNMKCKGKTEKNDYDAELSATGGLFGWAAFGKISNVNVKNADISAIARELGYAYAGGIMAIAYECSVENCNVYNSKIEAKTYPEWSVYAGGIIGYSTGAVSVKICASVGNTVKHAMNGGGLIGFIDDDIANVTDCYVADCKLIADYEYNDAANSTLSAGIAYVWGSLVAKNCYVYNYTFETLENSKSIANLSGIYTPTNDGKARTSATNCYYYDENSNEVYAENVIEKTKDDFKDGTVLNLLKADRADTMWTQDVTVDKYPVFWCNAFMSVELPETITYTGNSYSSLFAKENITAKALGETVSPKAYAIEFFNSENQKISSDDVKNAGEYTVKISVDETDKKYKGTSEIAFEIEKAKPTENAATTATVRKGGTLAEATVTKGEMLGVDGTTVLEGDFAWVDDTKVMTADGTEQMTFTPTDTNYAPITVDVAVKTYSTGGGGSVPRYTVKFDTDGGNAINSQVVEQNSKATEPKEPTKDGYIFDGWYTDSKFTNKYNFDTKITKNTVIYAKWAEDKPQDPVPTPSEWENTFADVTDKDWFFNNVKYANKNNLMNGITETEFAPNSELTRGMLVTILYRLAGEPATNKSIPFADVTADSYYANAVIWAEKTVLFRV